MARGSSGAARTDLPTGPPLFWLSLRRRPVGAALLFVISAIAVLASILGPLLVRAVHESALADAIATGGAAGTQIEVRADVGTDATLGDSMSTVLTVLEAGRQVAPELWQEPQTFLTTAANGAWRAPRIALDDAEASRLTASDRGCAGFVLTAGRCPSGPRQVLLGSTDARRHHLSVGDQVLLAVPDTADLPLRITGLYDATRSDQALLLRPSTSAGALAQVSADPLVVTTGQLSAIHLPDRLSGRLLLRPAATVDVDAEPALRRSVDAVTRSIAAQQMLVEFDTALPGVLDAVAGQAAQARVLIEVTAAQALALVIFTLAVVVQRLSRARAAEWSLGRLRGVPRIRWLASVYAEPLAALLAGLPVGWLAGVALAGLVATRELRPGTPVDPWRWPVLAAAAAALLAAVVALVATSLRTLRRPLIEVIQQTTESRRLSVAVAIAQTAAVVVALLSVYQLVTGGTLGSPGSQLALLAPAALALASSVVAVRCAALAVGRVTARPARTRTALIVGRQAARVPSSLNPAVLIAIGTAVALFATQAWQLSVRNQDLRASAAVGAGTVLTVGVRPGTDLIDAVRRADPTGRYAMAVQERSGSSTGGTGRIVAVDSARLAAVSSWSTTWAGVPDLAARLRGSPTDPIMIRGDRATVRLSDVRVALKPGISPGSGNPVDLAPGELAPPDLGLVVDTGERWQRVSLGPLTAAGQFHASLPCRSGCRLVGLQLESSEGSAFDARFVVSALDIGAVSSAPRGWLTDPAGWQERVADQTEAQPPDGISPAVGRGGLSLAAFDNEGGHPLTVARTDVVDPMPALLGPSVEAVGVGGHAGIAYGTGLSGLSQLIAVVGTAAVLPRSLDDGVLVDLHTARGLSDPAQSEAVDEVWLAADAPPEVQASLLTGGLAAQGLTVQASQQLDQTRTDLLNSANTRGTAVAAWVGLTGLLLTLFGLGAARLADAARRRADWSSLRDAGLSRAAIARLAFVEVAAPAWSGVVLGTIAGLVAVWLAAPRLPLVDLGSPGPPLDLAVDGVLAAGLVAATFGAVAVIAGLAAVGESRSAR